MGLSARRSFPSSLNFFVSPSYSGVMLLGVPFPPVVKDMPPVHTDFGVLLSNRPGISKPFFKLSRIGQKSSPAGWAPGVFQTLGFFFFKAPFPSFATPGTRSVLSFLLAARIFLQVVSIIFFLISRVPDNSTYPKNSSAFPCLAYRVLLLARVPTMFFVLS